MCRKQVFLISFVWVSGLVLTSGARAADSGPVGWWRFDETVGTTAFDSSGNLNHGTLINGPVWTAGRLGGALKFDGTDDHVSLPIGQLMSTLQESTLSLWVNFTGPTSTWTRFIDFGTGTSNYIYVCPRDGGGLFHVAITANTGTWVDLTGPTTLPADWHHVAVVLGNKTLQIYLDGVLFASSASLYSLSDLGNTTQNWLGRSQYAADAYFNGILDDFRIYKRLLSQDEIQIVMQGTSPGLAAGPGPALKATDVPRDAVLTWTPGEFSKTHDVYIGANFDDVNTASRQSPKGVLVSQGQEATTYDPAGLYDFDQTYYWRIDEVNAPDKPGLYKGNTWSFTAETYGYCITTPIKATASSFSNTLTGPEKTIDGTGLDALDQHSTSASQMWLSKKSQTPVWIKYEFDREYSLHQMWVWNQNQLTELDNGYGAKDVIIEVSTDGTAWTAVGGVPEVAQGTAEETYVHNTTVEFGGVLAKYVRLNINSNWGGAKSSGLSEVRFFYVPTKAFGPTPATGVTGMAVDGVLNWRPGRTAASHEVYLGTDPNALSKVDTVTDHRYSLASAGAEYDRTYYWKVNEVNEAQTPKAWEGDVWSFSTPGTFVVDDFESYDDNCKKVFYTWVDGYGHTGSPDCGVPGMTGNGSGSAVGYQSAPYAERTIIHGGKQAMPLFYDNPGANSYSEAIRSFTVPQDWEQGGIKTLVLYFHGDLTNAAGQLYVKINNNKVLYNGKSDVLTMPLWKQWNIDLASVGGNLRSVGSLTIGVSGTGKGLVYVDDIRLYRSAPAVAQPVDPGTTNRMAYYAMEGDIKDSSGHGYNGTLVGDPVFADGALGFGKALLFDGVNDYVELPIAPLLSTLTSVSITGWVNFDTSGSGTGYYERFFDFGTGTTVYMFLTLRQGATGAMRFAISTGGGGTAESGTNAGVPLPTGWHHVAGVIDGTTMTIQLYLDGTMVGSGPTVLVPKDLGKTTQNWLGDSQYTADNYYKGMMDEVSIYNRALSEGEVRYLAGDR